MNYSQTSISNLALGRIGARGGISDVNEDKPNAKKVLLVWDPIFQEVLSERDWKFAKTRTFLQLSPQPPLYAYKAAWALPSDFLRFVRPRRRQINQNYGWMWGGDNWGWYDRRDPPFWPEGDWKVETQPTPCIFVASITNGTMTVTQLSQGQLSLNQPVFGQGVPLGTFISAFGTGTGYQGTYTLSDSSVTVGSEAMSSPNPLVGASKFVFTNYLGWCGPAKITYIQLISDYTQLMPGFVNCLANRLAAELAIAITEDKSKFEGMMQMYRDSLNSAEAQNETSDYESDETGSETWVTAGRYAGLYRGYWGGGW